LRSDNALTLALLAIAAGSAAQPAKPVVTCASCHTQQALSQPATSMAHALSLPGNNAVLKAHPMLTVRKGAFTYTVETHADQTTYSVSDGSQTMSFRVHWTFGAGSQTWVLEYEGRLYESMVSYYPAINGLDTTIGDQDIQPKNLVEAFGRQLRPDEPSACFGCHSTGSVTGNHLHLESLKPGVTCEHCHTGALNHLEAISHGSLQSVPPKLKKLSSEEISNFCGQCHRSWETVVRDRLRGEINVRFQPYRLANSKCFDGSDRRISCIACHDPHQEVVRDPVSYDSKCLACHASNGLNVAAHQTQTPKSCPVATSGCVTCHMPKVALPGGHQIFTDHDIRIVHANEPYPN